MSSGPGVERPEESIRRDDRASSNRDVNSQPQSASMEDDTETVEPSSSNGATPGPDQSQQEKGVNGEDRDVVEMSALYATNSSVEPTPPPDGGLKAWTQVAMAWVVIFTTWGYINSFGAFQAYYLSVLSEAPSTISWIGSLQVWLTFVIGAFSGRLLDAGYFIPTFVTGAVLHLLGVFLMSLSTKYWQLMLTQGLLTGLGNGIMFTPSMALVATYFDRRRALAVGLVTTGNSAGGLVYPALVRAVLPQLGFGWTARVLGFLNLGGLLLVLVFMRPWLPPRKSGAIIEMSAFTEPVYVAYVGGLFSFVWGTYYSLYYLASFGRQVIGMPFAEAAILVTIVNGVGMPARVLTPMLAARIGPLNTMTIMAAFTATVAFSWLAVSDVTGTYAFTVFYGIASGAYQCLMPTGLASITPRLNKVGTRLGMAFSVASFAGLTGPPLGGAIESAGPKGYRSAEAWAAVMTLVAGFLVATARLLKTGLVAKAKA